jgi:hypothetical protein
LSTITRREAAEFDAYNRVRRTLKGFSLRAKPVQTIIAPSTASLERRVTSLTCDSLILTACCTALLLHYFGGTLVAIPMWLGRVGGAALLVMFIIEVLTGLTPGRLLTHTRLVCDGGSAVSFATLMMRAAIKWIPIGLLVFGFWSPSPLADLFWWADAILVQVYATVYYFAVARRDRSAFDLPVKTKITLARKAEL